MGRSRPGRAKPKQKRPRGRPASIDREQIVAAARSLGVPNLTMRAVADALGVTDAALYHHFGSRQELIAAVVDATLRGTRFPQDRGQDWQIWLTEFSRALRALLAAHPGSASFAGIGGPTSPEQVRLVARAIGVLTRSGFETEEAAMIYSLITSYVVSSVLAEEQRALARRTGRDIPTRFAEAQGRLSEREAGSLRRVAEVWASASADDRFFYGLRALIAGIASEPER